MQVSSISASALTGLARAQRSLDAAASAMSFSPVESGSESGTVTRSARSDSFEGVALGGDETAALVQMIAAQRAFTASLVVLQADADMQRTVIERMR